MANMVCYLLENVNIHRCLLFFMKNEFDVKINDYETDLNYFQYLIDI